MALIAHTIKASADGDTVTTDPIDTTGATFIAFTVSCLGVDHPISDSYGNAYSAPPAHFGALISFFSSVGTYVCTSPTVGPGHTFTVTPAIPGKNPSVAIQAWTNVGSKIEGLDNSGGSSTSATFDPLDPPLAGTLIMLTLARNTASAATASTGFTILGEVDPTGNNTGLTHAYMVAPDTSTVTPSWTWSAASTDRGGAVGMYAHTVVPESPEIFFVFGENGSVSSDRTALFNVDGVTRTVHEPDTVVIGSDLHVLGDITVDGTITGSTIDMEDVVSRLVVTEDGALVLDEDGVPLYSE